MRPAWVTGHSRGLAERGSASQRSSLPQLPLDGAKDGYRLGVGVPKRVDAVESRTEHVARPDELRRDQRSRPVAPRQTLSSPHHLRYAAGARVEISNRLESQ